VFEVILQAFVVLPQYIIHLDYQSLFIHTIRSVIRHKGHNAFHKGPNAFHKGPNAFHKGPNAFHKGPDAFHKGPDAAI